MRHHNANRKFGRKSNKRASLLRSLAVSLVLKEKIKTTDAKAREIRPYVEKLVTRGKTGTEASMRIIASRLGSKEASKKLIKELSLKYKDKNGGYLRIVKLPARHSDGSKMAHIEFV